MSVCPLPGSSPRLGVSIRGGASGPAARGGGISNTDIRPLAGRGELQHYRGALRRQGSILRELRATGVLNLGNEEGYKKKKVKVSVK